MATWHVTFIGPATGPLARAISRQTADEAAASASDRIRVAIADCGDDAKTMDALAHHLADATATAGAPVQIVAHIQQPALRHAIESRLESDGIHPRPQIVSAAELVARNFVVANPLYQQAFWRGQRRVHALMLGFGALGRALVDEIVMDGIADGLDRPLITILATEAEQIAARLDREMPEIAASAEIVVKQIDPAAIADPQQMTLSTSEDETPLTAIFILLDDTQATLLTAAALCDLQDRHGRAIADIFIGGPGAATALALATPRRPARILGRRIAAIPEIDAVPDLLTTILIDRDIVARRVHAAYDAKFGQQSTVGLAWETLGETYRRANRRAGRHLAQKLWSLGFDVSPDPTRVHKVAREAFARLITPLVEAPVEDRVIRGLARLEHDRWSADRRLDGWIHGERRDDARRTHPSLIPFDDPRLTAYEINKDIEQLRFLLGFVVEPDDAGAAVRFTVGIIGLRPHMQPGAPIEHILARLDEEQGRDVVLVSPLSTPEECAATLALASQLTDRNRPFRLLVPEPAQRGALLGPTGDATGAADLAQLLDRQDTRIVPVGSPEEIADDGWDDGSMIDERQDAIVNHVLALADVLLDTVPSNLHA